MSDINEKQNAALPETDVAENAAENDAPARKAKKPKEKFSAKLRRNRKRYSYR